MAYMLIKLTNLHFTKCFDYLLANFEKVVFISGNCFENFINGWLIVVFKCFNCFNLAYNIFLSQQLE